MPGEEDRLWDEQQQIANLLSRPGVEGDNDILAAASHLLARSLASVVEDRRFWDKLRQANADVRAAPDEQLRLLVQVPWIQVLTECRYKPPPQAVDVAHELNDNVKALVDARKHRANPDRAMDDLRSGLKELVGLLNQELEKPQSERDATWRRRLRHLAGAGLDVLRHVNLARLAWTATDATIAALPAALATGPGLALVAAMVVLGSVVAAASTQFRGALNQLQAEKDGAGVDDVVNTMDGILRELDEAITHHQSRDVQIRQKGHRRSGGPGGEPVPARSAGAETDSRIANFRGLERQVGALLPSAWVYCSAQAGARGRRLIEAASDSNAALHTAITGLTHAAHQDPRGYVNDALNRVVDAVKTLASCVRDLRDLLVSLGVATKRPGDS